MFCFFKISIFNSIFIIGSTAVVAIISGGWPYETPVASIEASPRNSTASSSSRRSSGNTNKSHISFNSSSQSLIHNDSFIKHALSGGSDLEVVLEDTPNRNNNNNNNNNHNNNNGEQSKSLTLSSIK